MRPATEPLPSGRAMCDDAPVSYDVEAVAAGADPRPAPAQRPAAIETEAWAVIGAAGAVSEFSAYLMIFPDLQEAQDHVIPAEGERLARVLIREVAA